MAVAGLLPESEPRVFKLGGASRQAFQGGCHKGVDALPLARGGGGDTPMQLGRHPDREMPGIGPLRLFATLPTPFDIVGDRVGKGGL